MVPSRDLASYVRGSTAAEKASNVLYFLAGAYWVCRGSLKGRPALKPGMVTKIRALLSVGPLRGRTLRRRYRSLVSAVKSMVESGPTTEGLLTIRRSLTEFRAAIVANEDRVKSALVRILEDTSILDLVACVMPDLPMVLTKDAVRYLGQYYDDILSAPSAATAMLKAAVWVLDWLLEFLSPRPRGKRRKRRRSRALAKRGRGRRVRGTRRKSIRR